MKRIVLRFKHKPTGDYKQDQEWRNYTVKDYPKLPTWAYFSGFAILAIGVGVGFWAGGSPGSCAGLLAGFCASVIVRLSTQCRLKLHPENISLIINDLRKLRFTFFTLPPPLSC
jgi:hypothetical protein